MWKRWTPEEDAILKERWGLYKGGVPGLAKTLGRSENAIRVRATHLKLGPWLDGNEWITFNQLRQVVNGGAVTGKYGYDRLRWTRMGLPLQKRVCIRCRWLCVRITDFWNWAYHHQRELDFSRFEENALGLEPNWAKEKRKVDVKNRMLIQPKKQRWTDDEIHHLRCLLENGATYTDLERELQRSAGAIRRKIYDLYLPRPKRSRCVPWPDEDNRQLVDLIERGYSVEYCARHFDRSPEAVRGRIDFLKKRGQWDEGGFEYAR